MMTIWIISGLISNNTFYENKNSNDGYQLAVKS